MTINTNDVIEYTGSASMQQYWLEQIAPNYFDMEDINLYRSGMFGYINEVMGTVAEDTAYGSVVTRREFYPNTAVFTESLYKMAALHNMNTPMASPSMVRITLLLQQSDILKYGKLADGIITYVIDDSMNIRIGELNFMLDYPIIILAKKKGTEYQYTTHYDMNMKNSLNTSAFKYIQNKIFSYEGQKYLMLDVKIHQVERQSFEESVQKISNLDVTIIDIDFEGSIANFEVFYRADESSPTIQLEKRMVNSAIPQIPFCQYMLISETKLRLIFPYNIHFVPVLNSIIRVNVYTTNGENGQFDVYTGNVVCEANSVDYPYNNQSLFLASVNGGTIGGKNPPSEENFRLDICDAYATNNTVTTENDLQLYFNRLMRSESNRIVFSKKRDDIYSRIFSAFMILKDVENNIIPTNTLQMILDINDFDEYYMSSDRLILYPGHIFKYGPNTGEDINYTLIDTGLKIMDEYASSDPNEFLFTNPFIISITRDPKVIGFYINTIFDSLPIAYSDVNDSSFIQWLANAFLIERNALLGENFYKLSLNIMASTIENEELIQSMVVDDTTDEYNPSGQDRPVKEYRAQANGRLASVLFNVETGRVEATFLYDDPSEGDAGRLVIPVSSNVTYDTMSSSYLYDPGYFLNFQVGEHFLIDDILATRKLKDTGKLRAIMNIPEYFEERLLYIPFSIEEYDEESMVFKLCAYISTDDYISISGMMRLTSGVYDSSSMIIRDVVVPSEDFAFEIGVFFQYDDINYPHKYTHYQYLMNHTMANTYKNPEDTKIRFIQDIKFIRSSVTFVEIPETPITISNPPSSNTVNYSIMVSEVPVVKAKWVELGDNYKYLLNVISSNYQFLTDMHYQLQNTFNIDLKFFNTYGKSRFYFAGSRNTLSILDRVNCKFTFGIKLDTLSSVEVFERNFIEYVKEYVESLNDINQTGKSIYIMNMIADLKQAFDEINYLEYYGINITDPDNMDFRIQTIESLSYEEIQSKKIEHYVPEFINIYTEQINGINVPQIEILYLQ